MKILIRTNSSGHQQEHAKAMAAGFKRHGIPSEIISRGALRQCDIAVIWGYRPQEFMGGMKALGTRLIVMERGFFPDRMKWTFLGWDGLNNRAKLPESQDNGERLEANWPGLLKPWKTGGEHILICGQLSGDAALRGLDLKKWAQNIVNQLYPHEAAMDWISEIRYRPHPWANSIAKQFHPEGTTLSVGKPLEGDLEKAERCITFNSNSGVDAVMAGVPTVTLDEGAMAWPMASHAVDAHLVRPGRTAWARKLSWCQWRMSEIADGTAWEILRQCA